MASDDFDNDFERDASDIIDKFFAPEASLRSLARQTGIPYSTLQAIKSGTTKNPSQRTIDRLQGALDTYPVRRAQRSRTYADDTPSWTLAKLANLQPPPGSRAWRFVVRVRGTNSGVASTPWVEARRKTPADRVMEGDLDPRAILRVVWDRP